MPLKQKLCSTAKRAVHLKAEADEAKTWRRCNLEALVLPNQLCKVRRQADAVPQILPETYCMTPKRLAHYCAGTMCLPAHVPACLRLAADMSGAIDMVELPMATSMALQGGWRCTVVWRTAGGHSLLHVRNWT